MMALRNALFWIPIASGLGAVTKAADGSIEIRTAAAGKGKISISKKNVSFKVKLTYAGGITKTVTVKVKKK